MELLGALVDSSFVEIETEAIHNIFKYFSFLKLNLINSIDRDG